MQKCITFVDEWKNVVQLVLICFSINQIFPDKIWSNVWTFFSIYFIFIKFCKYFLYIFLIFFVNDQFDDNWKNFYKHETNWAMIILKLEKYLSTNVSIGDFLIFKI